MSIWFLRDLKKKNKTWITPQNVKVYHAPQYEGLDKLDMLEWAKDYQDVKDALPDTREDQLKLSRDYISTIIFTIRGQPFMDWCQ